MKDKLIALGLDTEMVTKVEGVFKEILKDSYVPLSRVTELTQQKAKLEDDIKTRDTQLEELKKASGDTEKLNAKIQELQDLNAKNKADYEATLKAMRTDDFIKETLVNEGLIDLKYLPGVKGFLSIADLDVDNVKSVEKFKDSIGEVKTLASQWFKSNTPPEKELGGLKINDPANKTQVGSEPTDKGSYDYFLKQVGVE